MLISAKQQSDSDIYIYIYTFKKILFHYGLSQDTEYSSLCYTVGPCCKSERERQIPYDITYMCNLKYETNESI